MLGVHKMKFKFSILKNMWTVFENILYKCLRARMGKMWLQISSHVQKSGDQGSGMKKES